jgi:hypothetical protein
MQVSKSKVLYYSVNFDYKNVMDCVKKTLFVSKEYDDDISGIYTKTTDSYYPLDGEIKEDDKKIINSKYSSHIDKMKTSENFILYKDLFFIANSEFHITTLFTGGKVHEKSSYLESEVGRKVSVKINKLGVSGNFITMGVESIKFEDGTDIAYYGNDVKHITIALNKTGKKVFPKDSYTALSDGKIFTVDYTIEGTTSRITQ